MRAASSEGILPDRVDKKKGRPRGDGGRPMNLSAVSSQAAFLVPAARLAASLAKLLTDSWTSEARLENS